MAHIFTIWCALQAHFSSAHWVKLQLDSAGLMSGEAKFLKLLSKKQETYRFLHNWSSSFVPELRENRPEIEGGVSCPHLCTRLHGDSVTLVGLKVTRKKLRVLPCFKALTPKPPYRKLARAQALATQSPRWSSGKRTPASGGGLRPVYLRVSKPTPSP